MPSVAVPPAKWHHEIPQRAAPTFENADSSKVGYPSGATHVLGGRELNHFSTSQSGVPLQRMPHLGTIGSDVQGTDDLLG